MSEIIENQPADTAVPQAQNTSKLAETQEKLYWSKLGNEDWQLYLAADAEGFAFCGSLNGPFQELTEWAAARRPGAALEHSGQQLQPYADELAQYFAGSRSTFDMPLSLRGTPFQMVVWRALQAIPYGETRSYADIADAIGRPSAARAVGAAIGANPVLMPIPCHRVIGASGALTGYRGGMEMKQRLLTLEQGELTQ
ncbi:methylated-DNA--[protein]-cysteine S-methyltransferase [Paenibacillus herberti]|uniref:methylated-DNA--[protein]-cysteine S-methyltransferase n=1 Tax=Paenibacillus herberti TaxID=1619309 RepID=A0A229NZL4_9BACL|nr:methylated-DNA--[protein]-cysteine S-methyltransferase [Paenibacillus herberti]OXM15476.1 cysteine methyltransferase [Paenibacillus herberti]